MIDEAHARGIRVVLDGVFNHASRGFFQFHDIMENGPNSAYLDWFTVKDFPLNAYDTEKAPNYQAWWGLPALPKFNTDCPEVREFLWGIGRKWIEFGIDGWRLDVPNEIDDDAFWREFRVAVRAVNPEAYIVGEVWTDAQRWLKGDMWDAVMNYQFTRACIAFFIGEDVDEDDLKKTSLFRSGPTTAEAFRRNIERLLGLVSSQRVERDAQPAGQPRHGAVPHAWRSGDQVGAAAGDAVPDDLSRRAVDLLRRRDRHGGRPRPGQPRRLPLAQDRDLGHRALARIPAADRPASQRPALRRGSFQFLWAADDVVAFARQLGDETIVVVLNASRQSRRLDLPVGNLVPDETVLGGMLDSRDGSSRAGHAPRSELAPRSGRVFATPV